MLIALSTAIVAYERIMLPNIGEKAVTVATTARHVQTWLDEHLTESCVLGFDTETRPSFKKGQVNPPAVVQLSTMDACLVAQIFVAKSHLVGGRNNRVRTPLPQAKREAADEVRAALVDLLENRDILKAGVGIDDDAVDLWQSWGVEMNGRVELGYGAADNRPRGLARLLLDATGITLEKSASVQRSDWAEPLSERQVIYAAADAWAGMAIYDRLRSIDDATFGYDAVRQRLLDQKGCASLFAMRAARQACKSALASLSDRLTEDGLPQYRGGAEQSRLLAKRTLRTLSAQRSEVSRALASDKSLYLPVGQVLEDFAATVEREEEPCEEPMAQ